LACRKSASGKSTWAMEFVAKHNDYVRISRDNYRFMLQATDTHEPKIEALITKLVNNSISQALKVKYNVIYDATNLKLKSINEIIDEFGDIADIDICFLMFQ
jgi:predicted kinase